MFILVSVLVRLVLEDQKCIWAKISIFIKRVHLDFGAVWASIGLGFDSGLWSKDSFRNYVRNKNNFNHNDDGEDRQVSSIPGSSGNTWLRTPSLHFHELPAPATYISSSSLYFYFKDRHTKEWFREGYSYKKCIFCSCSTFWNKHTKHSKSIPKHNKKSSEKQWTFAKWDGGVKGSNYNKKQHFLYLVPSL